MYKFLSGWFAAPVFEGEREKSLRARLINTSIHAAILLAAITLLSGVLTGQVPLRALVVDACILVSFLVYRYWLRRGWLLLAGVAGLLSGGIYITAMLAALGTMRSPSTATYLLLVVAAGVLYDLPGVLGAAFFCSAAVGGLILAENAGLLPAPDTRVTLVQWVTYSGLFGLAGALTLSTYRALRGEVQRSDQEIKERERAQDEMRTLLRAVEQSPASIVITDLGGRIEYVNPRFTLVTGYSLEEALGQNPRILKSDLTPPETHAEMWSTLQAGQEWRGEFINRKKDGSLYYEAAIISPIKDAEGITTHYLAVKEDITQRKRMEEELRTSEGRFRALFEQAHDAVFILDLQGYHLAANQRAAEMLGYTSQEIQGLSLKDTSAELEQSQNMLARLLAGEHIPTYERWFRKKNGQVFPVEINVELIRDASGQPLHIQSVVRDISQRKQDQDALLFAHEQLVLRVAEIEKLQAKLREQALRDPLTGLYNRRYLNDNLQREIIRAEREQCSLSVIAIDIDYFKKVNDTYGHQVGDRFLIGVAEMIKGHVRGSDFVCRFGGEEFLVVLPGASTKAAARRAEEIRQKSMETFIEHDGQDLSVTLSLGVASFPEHGQTGEEVLIKADNALYCSKEMGRNRVTIYGKGSQFGGNGGE